MARVDGDLRNEEVSLELIEASVGDVVLVHAKVAIAKLLRSP
jgi:hydrogenase maturation factor